MRFRINAILAIVVAVIAYHRDWPGVNICLTWAAVNVLISDVLDTIKDRFRRDCGRGEG